MGHLGTQQLAAVGLANVFYIFLVFNFSTFQVTTTSLVGTATARNDRRAGCTHYAKALWMALAMGALLAVLMASCSHWLVAGMPLQCWALVSSKVAPCLLHSAAARSGGAAAGSAVPASARARCASRTDLFLRHWRCVRVYCAHKYYDKHTQPRVVSKTGRLRSWGH